MNSKTKPSLFAGVLKTVKLLEKKDHRKLILVVGVQVALSILDLCGVAIIGMIATIAVRGLNSQVAGDRASQLLKFLGLNNSEIQNQLFWLGLLAVCLLVVKTVISVMFLRKTYNFLSQRGAVITSNLIAKLLNQNIEFLQKVKIQNHLFNLTTGVNNLIVGVLNNTILIFSDLSLLLMLTLGLLVVNIEISAITLSFFSILGCVLYYLTHSRATKIGKEFSTLSIKSNQDIYEAILSFREIFVRGGREHYLNKIISTRKQLAKFDAEMKFLPNISKYVAEIAIILGALIVSSVLFATQDSFRAVGILAVFMAASTRIAPAIMRIQQNVILMKVFLTSSAQTLNLADYLNNSAPLGTSMNRFNNVHANFSPHIQIENLNFGYEDSKTNVLNGVNLTIKEGEMIALVGPSGGGKSTLVDLILGLLKPKSGRILISNITPVEVTKKWPGAIGFVPQKVTVHNGTVLQNICLGYEETDVPSSEINRALKIANLNDFIESLPDNLNHRIYDNGNNFSGGQLQRLGIARAILTNPKLLIFDEATSSLDAETEQRISESILSLRGTTTLIIVAHRLSTIRQADQIYYIDKGEIKSQGKFDELINSNTEFRNQANLMGLI